MSLVSIRVLLVTIVLSGCKSATPEPASPAPSGSAAGLPNVAEVAADVVVLDCPDSAKLNPRAAEGSIHRLVEGCTTVPGGIAHFAATLQPGGRIELAAPDGNTAEGVVPTCVLKHELVHKLPLHQACKLDVRLSERKPGST